MSRLKKFSCMILCILFISMGSNLTYSKDAKTNSQKTALADNIKTEDKSSTAIAKTNTKAASKVLVNLNKITFDKTTNKVNMELTGKPSKTNCFYISEGNKVVLDIYNCVNRLNSNKIKINSKNILDVRNSQFTNNPSITRVVVDLNKKIDYKLVSADKKITLAFAEDNTINNAEPSKNTSPANNSNNSGAVNNNPGTSGNNSGTVGNNPGASGNNSGTVGNDPGTAANNPGTSGNDTNDGKVDNVIKSKNEVTYKRTDKSTFHISNMKSLKYFLEDKTISFQLDSSYDLSSLEGVEDDYVEGVEVISAQTFNTVIITMKDSYQPITEISGDGVNLVIGNMTPQPTQPPVNNKQRTVVIDPGHGGRETGAVGCGLVEKNLNLDIALRVKTLLEAQNIKVYMTRTKDEYFDKSAKTVTEELTARAQYASSVKADFFVSIHTNSATPSASGIETLYYPTDGPYKKTLKKGKLNSIDFAQIVQDELIKSTGAVKRNIVPRPNLLVLKYNQVVPILAEVGFISNPKEAALLKTDSYKQKIAQGICNGIMKAYSKN